MKNKFLIGGAITLGLLGIWWLASGNKSPKTIAAGASKSKNYSKLTLAEKEVLNKLDKAPNFTWDKSLTAVENFKKAGFSDAEIILFFSAAEKLNSSIRPV